MSEQNAQFEQLERKHPYRNSPRIRQSRRIGVAVYETLGTRRTGEDRRRSSANVYFGDEIRPIVAHVQRRVVAGNHQIRTIACELHQLGNCARCNCGGARHRRVGRVHGLAVALDRDTVHLLTLRICTAAVCRAALRRDRNATDNCVHGALAGRDLAIRTGRTSSAVKVRRAQARRCSQARAGTVRSSSARRWRRRARAAIRTSRARDLGSKGIAQEKVARVHALVEM